MKKKTVLKVKTATAYDITKKHPLKFESRFKRLACKLKGEKYYPNTYMSIKQALTENRTKYYEIHPFVGINADTHKKVVDLIKAYNDFERFIIEDFTNILPKKAIDKNAIEDARAYARAGMKMVKFESTKKDEERFKKYLQPDQQMNDDLPKFCIAHHCTQRSGACAKCAYTAMSVKEKYFVNGK